MEQFYTNERNVQILIALLKAHGIKRIIVSPGSTNVTFVGSIQQDPFFEIYSCVDERSAAYMACGMAAESGEPVALSCTGATASRNYFPALTEAYYRKLPILAITSTQDISKVGHQIPQVIDRTSCPVDTVKFSVHLQTIKDNSDVWDCTIKANQAILELFHHGTGPVHINLTTTYSRDFSVKELPFVRMINRICIGYVHPQIKLNAKVAIYCGTHLRWSQDEIELIDRFCSLYNAVVFTDPAANYTGKYRVPYELVAQQSSEDSNICPDLLIHIGNMSDMYSIVGQPKEVWRVSEDGAIVDTYSTLTNVYEMSESYFFNLYNQYRSSIGDDSYLLSCISSCERLWKKVPELPFSHIWVASQLYDKLPINSVLHLGILSPLRSWGYFNIPSYVNVFCNQGGFGIDGNMSSLLGASVLHSEKIYYGVVGDLSFFYDMNVLGNRHIGKNIRILLINNSLGAEFKLFKQRNCTCINDVEAYISAAGHFGNKSMSLVKHYAEDLGFEYLSASTKEEFYSVYKQFVNQEFTDKSMIFEVFTCVEDENEALFKLYNIEMPLKNKIKKTVKNIVGEKKINMIKRIIK